MTKRIRANGQTQLHARYQTTGGCDMDKNIFVAAIYHANSGHLNAQEFLQHREDALRAAASGGDFHHRSNRYLPRTAHPFEAVSASQNPAT